MSKIYNIVFFGTPEFSVSSLKTLHNNPQINISRVVSMPDRKAGRGKRLQSPAVIDFAREEDLPFIQTANINKEEDFLSNLELEEIDFFVVIAFSQFLGSRLLSIPRLGAFNIHTSLLPKYRGAAPIQYALLNGDRETGVSIQRMVKKMDAGDIAYSHTVPIEEGETSQSLFNKLETQAAMGLEKFTDQLIEDESSLKLIPQDETKVSFAPIIAKADGLIKPKTESALEVFNKTKAYFPWPGTFIYINGQRLKVLESEIVSTTVEAGKVNHSFGTLIIGTCEGSIRLKRVQLDGKKPINDSEYINGVKNRVSQLEVTNEAALNKDESITKDQNE